MEGTEVGAFQNVLIRVEVGTEISIIGSSFHQQGDTVKNC